MYIFELLAKLKRQEEENKIKFSQKTISAENEIEYDNCEHVFYPIDSTKKVLACSKCGFVTKVKSGNNNIFKNNGLL